MLKQDEKNQRHEHRFDQKRGYNCFVIVLWRPRKSLVSMAGNDDHLRIYVTQYPGINLDGAQGQFVSFLRYYGAKF